MSNLTIQDLRNDKFESGYAFVGRCGGAKAKPWRAQRNAGASYGGPNSWRGPTRASAADAAQDYCDHMNGNFIQPSFSLKSAGHPSKPSGPRATRNDGHVVAPKRPKEGPGYVYLIVEVDDKGWAYGKIGESRTEPKYRLAGLQTGNRRKLMVIGQIKTDTRLALEARLHQKYLRYNELGEWFKLTPAALAEFGLKRKRA